MSIKMIWRKTKSYIYSQIFRKRIARDMDLFESYIIGPSSLAFSNAIDEELLNQTYAKSLDDQVVDQMMKKWVAIQEQNLIEQICKGITPKNFLQPPVLTRIETEEGVKVRMRWGVDWGPAVG